MKPPQSKSAESLFQGQLLEARLLETLNLSFQVHSQLSTADSITQHTSTYLSKKVLNGLPKGYFSELFQSVFALPKAIFLIEEYVGHSFSFEEDIKSSGDFGLDGDPSIAGSGAGGSSANSGILDGRDDGGDALRGRKGTGAGGHTQDTLADLESYHVESMELQEEIADLRRTARALEGDLKQSVWFSACATPTASISAPTITALPTTQEGSSTFATAIAATAATAREAGRDKGRDAAHGLTHDKGQGEPQQFPACATSSYIRFCYAARRLQLARQALHANRIKSTRAEYLSRSAALKQAATIAAAKRTTELGQEVELLEATHAQLVAATLTIVQSQYAPDSFNSAREDVARMSTTVHITSGTEPSSDDAGTGEGGGGDVGSDSGGRAMEEHLLQSYGRRMAAAVESYPTLQSILQARRNQEKEELQSAKTGSSRAASPSRLTSLFSRADSPHNNSSSSNTGSNNLAAGAGSSSPPVSESKGSHPQGAGQQEPGQQQLQQQGEVGSQQFYSLRTSDVYARYIEVMTQHCSRTLSSFHHELRDKMQACAASAKDAVFRSHGTFQYLQGREPYEERVRRVLQRVTDLEYQLDSFSRHQEHMRRCMIADHERLVRQASAAVIERRMAFLSTLKDKLNVLHRTNMERSRWLKKQALKENSAKFQ